MLRSRPIAKQSGETWSQSSRRKRRLRWARLAEKEGFKPRMKVFDNGLTIDDLCFRDICGRG